MTTEPAQMRDVLAYANGSRAFTGKRIKITGYAGTTLYMYKETVNEPGEGWVESVPCVLAAKGYDPRAEVLVLPAEPELAMLVMHALSDWANAEDEEAQQRIYDPEGRRMCRAAAQGLSTAQGKVAEVLKGCGVDYHTLCQRVQSIAHEVVYDGTRWTTR